ncbi:hypothetical protein Tco_1085925 [Tanacetum coccineum]
MSRIIKSTGKVNLTIPTSMFSAIPFGYFTVLSTNSTVNLVVLFCPVDMAYWDDPIRCIEYESASIVVVSVEFGRLPNPLLSSTLLICPICISKVLIDAPWFLMAASVVAQNSLIKLEFSSCLFADSLMNLLRVSFIDCLRSWYKGFALFP